MVNPDQNRDKLQAAYDHFVGGSPTLIDAAGLTALREVEVLHVDERTGREIIKTGTDPDTGRPDAGFRPQDPADIQVPYLDAN